MTVRHLLSIAELGAENLAHLIKESLAIIAGDQKVERPLEGKIVGIYFRGTSTRTRTAFTIGATHLGAATISYGPNDLQIVTGETIEDTARVLSNFLDILVIRTNQSVAEMRALTDQKEMSIINAMSDSEHPTQAIADLVTLHEEFGRLDDIHVLYLGEGNNTAASLALAVAQTPGMSLTLVTPEGYGLKEGILETAHQLAVAHGAHIENHHLIDRLPANVDAVYTSRWQTMGVPKAEENWEEKFEPFRVTSALMARVSKPAGTIFLHDLPAVRGGDVDDEVLDGPQSRAFRQARHKMTSAMAVLAWCGADRPTGYLRHDLAVSRWSGSRADQFGIRR
jgi:ornithine carbamoyltransferase